MEKFEYRIVKFFGLVPTEEKLNYYGKQGLKVVGVLRHDEDGYSYIIMMKERTGP